MAGRRYDALDQLLSLDIFPFPSGLHFNHAAKRFRAERIRRVMKRNSDPAAVRALVMAMATGLARENETIPLQCSDQAARGNGPQLAEIGVHHTVTETSGSS